MEPDLRLVPLSSIDLQEEGEGGRLDRLAEAFKVSRMLKDPPVVAKGLGKKLIQLDGTNRINVLKRLGCSHAVVQMVDYNDTSQVLIKSWVHVSKVNKKDFLKKLKRLSGVKTENFKLGLGVTLTGHPLAAASIIFRDGTGLSIYSNSDLYKRVRTLKAVVKLYGQLITRDRQVSIESMAQLSDFFSKHADKNVALLFPSFSGREIISLIRSGITLPTGVTRHIVNGRVLRINYPLAMLEKKAPLRKKKRFFKEFLDNLNLRFYEESTFVVE
ncbi:MAG TPA: hypothetical protein VJ227_02155 [Patescibacteria group bacterium]|nr:hypothetical protein [Patescibacteria group bacterium]